MEAETLGVFKARLDTMRDTIYVSGKLSIVVSFAVLNGLFLALCYVHKVSLSPRADLQSDCLFHSLDKVRIWTMET